VSNDNDNQLIANDITTLRNIRASYWPGQTAGSDQGIAADNAMLQPLQADVIASKDNAGKMYTVNAIPTLSLGDLPNTTNSPNMVSFQVLGNTAGGGADILSFSAGLTHSMLLQSNGTVWTCGWNSYGQLGDGTTTDHSWPVQVSNLSDIIAVSAGGGGNCSLTASIQVQSPGQSNDCARAFM